MTTLHGKGKRVGRLASYFGQRQHWQDYSNSICPVAEVISGCGKSGEWKLSHQTLVPLSQTGGQGYCGLVEEEGYLDTALLP